MNIDFAKREIKIINNKRKLFINGIRLVKGSKITFKCNKCGNEITQSFNFAERFLNLEFICRNCATKKTNLQKYGVENAFQSEEIKDKIKQTNLKRYGVESPMQLDKIKDKIKATNLKNYGVEYGLQSEIIKEKTRKTNLQKYGSNYPNAFGTNNFKENMIKKHGDENYNNIDKAKQTCLKNYGVENPSQSEEIKIKIKQTMQNKYNGIGWGSKDINKRIKQTCLKNYGVENPSQSEEIQKLKKETNFIHHGTEYPLQSEEIKNKMHQTMVERYGVEHALQSEGIKNKIKTTNMERYGVEYPLQNPTFFYKYMESLSYKKLNENLHYQSIPELNFIHYCQSNNIDIWDGPSIPYYLDGKKHIYHVDFETNKWVVEIKSSHHWYRKDLESGKIGAKNRAAREYADRIGKEFLFLLDVKNYDNFIKIN